MTSEESLRELCPCPLQLVVVKWDLGPTTLRQSNHLPLWTTMWLLGPGWFSWTHPNAPGSEDTLAGQCPLSVCVYVCVGLLHKQSQQFACPPYGQSKNGLSPWFHDGISQVCASAGKHTSNSNRFYPLWAQCYHQQLFRNQCVALYRQAQLIFHKLMASVVTSSRPGTCPHKTLHTPKHRILLWMSNILF